MSDRPLTRDERKRFAGAVMDHFDILQNDNNRTVTAANIEQLIDTVQEFKNGAVLTSPAATGKVIITYEYRINGG